MTGPLRIAFLTGPLEVDDPNVLALDLVPALAARGHDVRVYGGPGTLAPRFEERGVSIRSLPGSGGLRFRERREGIVSIGQSDLIHVLDPRQARRGGRLALLTGRPWLLSVTSVLPSATLDAIHRPSAVLVSCRSARDEIILARPAARDRVHVVPSGVDPRRFAANGGPLGAEAPVVGALTRFDGSSGVPDLLEAVRILKEREIEIHVIVAGNGSRGFSYRRLARRLGVSGCVTVTSVARDFEPVLAAMDVFVSPRRRDWFGGPILQAMAAGRPVIAAGVGAAFSLIREPENGRLTPGADPAALADAIDEMLGDPDEAQRLGENARKIVSTEHTADLAAERTERIYREVLGRVSEETENGQ
jgi:glycosyltransferase involved in cell wall biosynthesis